MMRKIRRWADYVRTDGIANASVYALYKAFPAPFRVLTESIRHNPAASLNSPAYFDRLLDSVFDDASWAELGGTNAPVVPSTRRDHIVWFVPDWTNVWGGGHYTLFRFANYFASRGAANIIYVYNNERHRSPSMLQSDLDRALQPCHVEVVVDPKRLPQCAIAFATTWQSAYHVRAFPFADRKMYFMQDYECQFYPYGTASLQAMATYGFGFDGITGGGWLKSRYEAHGGRANAYRFAADRQIFWPADKAARVRPEIKRIFFYGRPSTERRCFELGLASLKRIAGRYPNVEIVIAGLDLQSPPPFRATLMGNLSLRQTADLYRTCDLGLAFSATNLSYLPVELMACGVPVLSNKGPQVEWHCRDGDNAFLVDPSPAAVLAGFTELYESQRLRQKLVEGGLRTMAMLSWEDEMAKVYARLDLGGARQPALVAAETVAAQR